MKKFLQSGALSIITQLQINVFIIRAFSSYWESKAERRDAADTQKQAFKSTGEMLAASFDVTLERIRDQNKGLEMQIIPTTEQVSKAIIPN